MFEVETVSDVALTYRLHHDEKHRQIEIVRFFEYQVAPGTVAIVLGAIGDYSDSEGLGDPAHAQAIASVGILAASVPRISRAILKGESANSAVQELWIANRLDERLHGAGPEARTWRKNLLAWAVFLPFRSILPMVS